MKFAVGTETAVEVSAGYFNGESLSKIYLNGNYVELGKKFTTYYGKFLTVHDSKYFAGDDGTKFLQEITADIIKDNDSEFSEGHTEVVKNIYRTIEFDATINDDYYSFVYYAFPAAALKSGNLVMRDENFMSSILGNFVVFDMEIDGVPYKVAINRTDSQGTGKISFNNE